MFDNCTLFISLKETCIDSEGSYIYSEQLSFDFAIKCSNSSLKESHFSEILAS